MVKRQLAWFMLAISLLCGVASCEKEKEETEQRLINKENKEAGERFLIENANQEGVKQTDFGLQYKIETAGAGIRPFPEDSVHVNYTGKLIDGTVFESATDVSLLLRSMIDGFQEGLGLMNEGATHTLYIPYYLAYNSSQKVVSYEGKTITVQPYSVLIFEVTLNRVTRN
jgi:FKBP-type peptidyl-prolyl cis-trans isomerase